MNAKKRTEERIFLWAMRLVTWSIIAVFFLLIVVVIGRGFRAVTWEMVTQVPQGGFYFGKGGGIANAIVGSFYLAFGSLAVAVVIGLPVALGMNVQLATHRTWVSVLRYFLDVLWGVPSIVYGAFGFTLMTFFHWRTSLLAGILTVSLLITPIVIRALDEVLRTIPRGLMETAYSLGATKTETAFVVFFRQALPGFVTALLLAFGRGIGDAASVLFTAGYTDHIPHSLMEPTATLPLAIFFQLSSPIPEVKARAYGATLILTLLILGISVASRLSSRRFKNHII